METVIDLTKKENLDGYIIARATDIYEGIQNLTRTELEDNLKEELKEDLIAQLDELRPILESYTI